MIKSCFKISLICAVMMYSEIISAQTPDFLKRSFYVGVIGGAGSTTWDGLVPSAENQNFSLRLSTPLSVDEGGFVWGFLTGYEFTRFFAVEANFMHFPQAHVFFDETSLFSFDNDGVKEFSTQTQVVNLLGKIMLVLPKTNIRVYSSAGFATMQRKDMMVNGWLVAPSFGAGVNCHVSEHLMAEFAGNYTAGYGDSRLSPSESYYPFLYSFSARLAYFF